MRSDFTSVASSASSTRTRDAFHWLLDFPLFQLDEETGRWTFVHHPFTSPLDGHEELIERDPASALSLHYDLVWNGWELGSGSIRIHRSDVQQQVFRAMGMTEDEANAKFGWFLEALQMGAPPHGGFALGLDRFIALLAGEPNIREVTAFPKVSSGSDPLTGAPSPAGAGAARGARYSRARRPRLTLETTRIRPRRLLVRGSCTRRRMHDRRRRSSTGEERHTLDTNVSPSRD